MERKSSEQLYAQMEEAEKTLGTDFFYDEERTEESLAKDEKELKEQYPYRYEKYLEILRKLAVKRKISKESDLKMDKEGNLDVSEEEIGEMREEFIPARKYITMTNNLERYINSYETENPSGKLREHQQDCFKDLLDFLNRGKRRGRIIMHTGSGKTAIFVELIKALSDVEGEGGIAQIRTLVVTPTIDLVKQTKGFDNEGIAKKGFAKFAEKIPTSVYYSENKDLTGDVVITTVQSFIKIIELMEQGKINADYFDLIIFDEADTALGEKTSSKIREIIAGKDDDKKNNLDRDIQNANPIIIGLTATGKRLEEEKNKDFFPELIHKLDIKEGIELGTAACPRAFLYETGFEFNEEIKKGDYTKESLEKLDIEARNKAGVDIAVSLIEKGGQGLVSCLPGDHIAHAKKIAKMLSERIIIDHKNREKRNVRAQYIGDDIASDEREEYYKKFEKGEIDCLAYVDALNRGWDSPNAKFSIHIRPILSFDLATQRAGRVLRPDEKGTDPIFVEFKDKFRDPKKEPCTIFHILGIKEFRQGERLIERKKKPSNNDEKKESPPLSPELLEKLNIKLDVVMELNNEFPGVERINKSVIKYKDKVYMTISEIAKIYWIKEKEVENLISENSEEPLTVGGKNYYLADKIIDLFLCQPFNPKILDDYLPIKTISEATGLSHKKLKNIAGDRKYKVGEIWGKVGEWAESKKKAVPFLFGAKNLDDETIEKLLREVEDPKSVLEICEVEHIKNDENVEYLLKRLKNIAGESNLGNRDDILRLLSSLAEKEDHFGIKEELERLKIEEDVPDLEDMKEKLNIIKTNQAPYKKIGKECDRLLDQLDKR